MGYGDHSGVLETLPDGLLDEVVGLYVDVSGSLVNQHQFAVTEDGSSDADELFFSYG